MNKALTKISHDKSIKCLKMDKGNGVVILNRKEYIKKMNKILEYKSKFKKLDFNQNCNKNDYEKAPWYKREEYL